MNSLKYNIIIPDNYCKDDQYIYDKEVINDILPIGNIKLKDLLINNPNLLLYPNNLNDRYSISDDNYIFTFNYNGKNQIVLNTNNIIGFICKNDIGIKIYSRFDDPNTNYWFYYMMSRVFDINLFDFSYNYSTNDILDILIMLFPKFLNDALAQGIYKEYLIKEYNNANVKGRINVSRYIRKDIPFKGSVAYDTREYTGDNYVFQLIRHTLEFINTTEIGKMILHSSKELEHNIVIVKNFTQSYKKQERNMVISKNIQKKVYQPYYTKYLALQDLCIKILQYNMSIYENNSDRLYGLLIDISWLFEEYLWTILDKYGFKHSENRKRDGGIKFFNGDSHRRYIDFYKDDDGIISMVFDAKYKKLGIKDRASEANADDIDQLITYMFITKCKKSAFLFPKYDEQNSPDVSTLRDSTYGGKLGAIGLNIPQNCKTYEEFNEQMQINEEMFENQVLNF